MVSFPSPEGMGRQGTGLTRTTPIGRQMLEWIAAGHLQPAVLEGPDPYYWIWWGRFLENFGVRRMIAVRHKGGRRHWSLALPPPSRRAHSVRTHHGLQWQSGRSRLADVIRCECNELARSGDAVPEHRFALHGWRGVRCMGGWVCIAWMDGCELHGRMDGRRERLPWPCS